MNHYHILNPSAQEFRPTYHHHHPPPPPLVYHSPPLPPPSTAPTRTLLLSSVPFNVTESKIRQNLEVFGDIRAIQMENITHGLVTVHFYDLRHARNACNEIQKQHMQQQYRLREHFASHDQNYAMLYNFGGNTYYYYYLSTPLPPPAPGLIGGRAVWAQFIELADGYNQGTLVVFNLDASGIDETVRESFVDFGCVKEFRGTRLEKNKMFVEFYDTRDAAKARNDMNGKKINGKSLRVEFSRPGGHKKGPKRSASNPVILERPPPHVPFDLLRKTGKKQPQVPNGGAWSYYKHRKCLGQTINEYDPRFFIKEDEVISGSGILDSRTTVMIKNIPNKYSTKLLLNLLDSHCIHCNEQINDGDNNIRKPLSSYDFVYLPIDFMNKCNKGYGFVNMTSPEATMRLYKAFHNKKWEVFNSQKICKVSYARFQGLDALKEHFKISRYPFEAKEYMPVVFDPPRDGRRLTKPTSIVV
ncbi:protein terminal ear1 homolog [Bidens hawaiensis]|uniref:protein terminal ear1 homolog n=1 Tax=Bidens hawaiensis TaxID=980011 RepID=UPI00404ACDB5